MGKSTPKPASPKPASPKPADPADPAAPLAPPADPNPDDGAQAVERSEADALFLAAQNEQSGLTLIPADKVEGNHTVEVGLIGGKPVTRTVNGVKLTVVRKK